MTGDPISYKELKQIEDDCYRWANNCGGCETCLREFGNPPPYSHQETFYLIQMIRSRDEEIERLRESLSMDLKEERSIKNAVKIFQGNLTESAKALGIGRADLYRKIKQYNIGPRIYRLDKKGRM